MTQLPLKLSLITNVVIAGAAFGIIYAWVVTVMWGLDAAGARTAIGAMVSMNERIQNGFFFIAFLAAPLFMWGAAAVCQGYDASQSAALLLAAGFLYILGVLVVTGAVNVPMNEALAAVRVPADDASAAEIWRAFSARWQLWNGVRAASAGVSFVLSAIAILRA